MNKHIKQSFQFRYIKIGNVVNTGVVRIGVAGSIKPPPFPKPKAHNWTSTTPTTAPQQFAPSVPLQAGASGASGAPAR